MTPSRSAIVTCRFEQRLACEVALGGASVQVPLSALWSRANAENAHRRVVKQSGDCSIEYIRMIFFRRPHSYSSRDKSPGRLKPPTWCRKLLIRRRGAGAFACESGVTRL